MIYLWLIGGFDNESICGRFLGMRLIKEGYLIVIDTYLGFFKVNVVIGVMCFFLNESMYFFNNFMRI